MATNSNTFSITTLPAPGGGTPLWRQGMAVGEWRALANTRLSDVSGVLTVPGNTGRNSVVDTWNGACIDPAGKVYLLACGGHADYAGNEVYKLDCTQDVPAWELAINTTPSGSIGGNATSGYYADGRPCSTHTYAQQVYVPEIGRAMRFGVGARYSDGYDLYKVDGFNPASSTWDAAGTYPDIAAASVNQQSWSTARDPATGNVWIPVKDPSGSQAVYRWNRATNTMTKVTNHNFYGYESCGAVDTTRNKVLFCRASENLLIDIATVATGGVGCTQPSIANGGPGTANGMLYSAAMDRYIYRSNAAGGTVRQIDPATLSSSAFTTTGGGSIPARPNGCYNAFGYFEAYGCAIYVAAYAGNVWALRLH